MLPRSGLAIEHGITCLNAPGLIDPYYRGEVRVILINHGTQPFEAEAGDRIAQLLIVPAMDDDPVVVDQLPPGGDDRGSRRLRLLRPALVERFAARGRRRGRASARTCSPRTAGGTSSGSGSSLAWPRPIEWPVSCAAALSTS